MKRSFVIEIISSLLILLFVYTAVSKLNDFTHFKVVLGTSPLIGSKSAVVAIALPTVEILVSLLLFFPKTRLWGLYGSLGLMTMFTLYLGYMIYFTPRLPCSCGGVLKQMTWRQHLVFNIFFLLISLAGMLLKKRQMRRGDEATLPSVVYT